MGPRHRIAAAASLTLLGWAGSALADGSNPKAISVDITCGLNGVNGDPNDTGVQIVNGNSGHKESACQQAAAGWFDGRVDWYSGNTLIYSEKGPFLTESPIGDKHTAQSVPIRIFLDGNDDATQFATFYDNRATTILTSPNLRLKVYVTVSGGGGNNDGDDGKKQKPVDVLITDQLYKPVASALWAKHSEDAIAMGADLSAEIAARIAGDKAQQQYTDQQVAKEAAQRQAGDAQTLSAGKLYTDQQVAAVRAEASADELQDTQELQAEQNARQQFIRGLHRRRIGHESQCRFHIAPHGSAGAASPKMRVEPRTVRRVEGPVKVIAQQNFRFVTLHKQLFSKTATKSQPSPCAALAPAQLVRG